MSTLTATPVTCSKAVLDFVERHELQACLPSIQEATLSLFPTATRLDIVLEEDAEIADDWSIVFTVDVPIQDVPDYVQADRAWLEEFFRLCPQPSQQFFILILHRI